MKGYWEIGRDVDHILNGGIVYNSFYLSEININYSRNNFLLFF